LLRDVACQHALRHPGCGLSTKPSSELPRPQKSHSTASYIAKKRAGLRKASQHSSKITMVLQRTMRARLRLPSLRAVIRARSRHSQGIFRHRQMALISGRPRPSWPEVVACYAMTGEMDYLLRVHVEDMEHFSRFMMVTLLRHPAVLDVKSSFALQRIKDTTALPLPLL
jgi:DNA-binding Lrp family transcriptional regulator